MINRRPASDRRKEVLVLARNKVDIDMTIATMTLKEVSEVIPEAPISSVQIGHITHTLTRRVVEVEGVVIPIIIGEIRGYTIIITNTFNIKTCLAGPLTFRGGVSKRHCLYLAEGANDSSKG